MKENSFSKVKSIAKLLTMGVVYVDIIKAATTFINFIIKN